MPVTHAQFRRIALAMPDAIESAHMNHPDFRAGGKIFATLGYPDKRWAMIKFTPEQQAAFTGSEPDAFIAVPGGWGKAGATNVRLEKATLKSLRSALEIAWENVTTPKAPPRPKRARS